MGQRSSAETLAKLFVAFLERETWRQKELELRCEVGARAIRRCLLEMQRAGVHLEREEDRPHVYWSVPKGWLPARALGDRAFDTKLIARLIARIPRSTTRERALASLVVSPDTVSNEAEGTVDCETLSALEDGASSRSPVRMAYYSASRGEHGLRTISVQRILYGDQPRFIAFCHSSTSLKWFRADRATSLRLAPEVPFIGIVPEAIDRFLSESLDGFRGRDSAETCELFVRAPESRWIVRNLPGGAGRFVVSHEEAGARVTGKTAALDVLARFVAGLGGSVHVERPSSLRARVRRIARETLLAHSDRKLNVGPASSNRSIRIGPQADS